VKRRNFFKTISLLPFIKPEITQPKDTEIVEVSSSVQCSTASAIRTDYPFPIASGYNPQGAFVYKNKDWWEN
jgi:hypothetical protein